MLRQLDQVWQKLDLYLIDQVETHLRWSKARVYARSDKPGIMLANHLKYHNRSHQPFRLNVCLTSNPKTFQDFQTHLQDLYSKPQQSGGAAYPPPSYLN